MSVLTQSVAFRANDLHQVSIYQALASAIFILDYSLFSQDSQADELPLSSVRQSPVSMHRRVVQTRDKADEEVSLSPYNKLGYMMRPVADSP